jgi:predicted esterase
MRSLIALSIASTLGISAACGGDDPADGTSSSSGNTSSGVASSSGSGASGSNGSGSSSTSGGSGTSSGNPSSSSGSSSGGSSSGKIPGPSDEPSTPPTKTCGANADKDGFFTMGKHASVARAAKTGTGALPLLILLHGCGDKAYNFATWAGSPFDNRSKQSYNVVSVGGRDGQCWDLGQDEPKITDELKEAIACFYVDRKRVFLGGYSSGGQLAYQYGLRNAKTFAALLIEHSSIPDRDKLIAGAAWPITVGAIGAINDSYFPPAVFNADWSALRAKGHVIDTQALPIGHDGRSDDWKNFLLPKMSTWKAP